MLRFTFRPSKKQIAFASLLLVSLLALMSASLYWYYNVMMQERQDKLRKMVDGAYALVEHYHEKFASHEMSEADAKRYALKATSELPYDVNGYCWINDMTGHIIMHPFKPELVNVNLFDLREPDGKYLFREFINIVKNHKEGFYRYAWAKPDKPDNKLYPKLSFVKEFAPWGWVIGSGIYIDDVNVAFKQAVLAMGGLIVALLMFTATLIMTLSESLRKPN